MHKNTALFEQIKHDIRNGITVRWKTFICFIAIVGFLCLISLLSIQKYTLYDFSKTPTFFDYLIYIMKGMEIFDPSNSKNYFSVPGEWLILHFSIGCVTANYPTKDLGIYGTQILLRSQKRSYWWISKCIWNFLSIVLIYICLLCTIAIFSIFTGGFSALPTPQIIEGIIAIGELKIVPEELILIAIILPMCISIGLSFFQMMIALYTKPIIGLVVIILNLIISAYFCSNWLPGNFLMLQRNSSVINSGVSTILGFTWAGYLVLMAIILGAIRLSKLDILKK